MQLIYYIDLLQSLSPFRGRLRHKRSLLKEAAAGFYALFFFFFKWSTSNRKNCTLVRIVKPSLSKNMGGGPGHSPCETISEAGAGLRTKRTKRIGLLLSGSKSSSAKSKFCISFRNQGPGYTDFKLPEVHCEVSTAAEGLGKHYLLVLIHYVLTGPRSAQLSSRRFLSTSCFLLLTSIMEIWILFSSTCPHWQIQ